MIAKLIMLKHQILGKHGRMMLFLQAASHDYFENWYRTYNQRSLSDADKVTATARLARGVAFDVHILDIHFLLVVQNHSRP
jgi:hypothetical protein